MKHKRTGVVLYILAILLCVSCSPVSHEEKSEPYSAPATAILGAFEREVTLLEDRIADLKEHQIEGIRFVTGKQHGKNVVMVWTGIGKVNAAMTTTLLIEYFKPEQIIFTGIAGAVNNELRPGDIVIAEKTAHHDMGTIWPEGLFVKGVKSRLDGFENPVFFPADEKLVTLAQKAAERIGMRRIETVTGQRKPKIITGVIVTGDSFIASTEKCAELRKKLEADAVEMEGAAVAQICYQRQIDHLVIRSISDSADEGAVTDKQMFYILAAKNSSDLVAEMISLLDSDLSIEEGNESQKSGD
ncbi:MAG: 5'-methylthioadenosine/adenosylhomocysteine nucleosidase [Sedimentisphaerales bacterium]|nr:5'-methylthioadenosine/adenosylhomocysteine nucleosidase [Sedimentisphaerales bacterium]